MSLANRLATRLPAPVRRAASRLPGAAALRRRLWRLPAAAGPGPGELRPVVYLPTWLTWDDMRQRPQYLLEAFAAHGHPVWFADPRAGRPYARGEVQVVPDLRAVPGRQPILYVHFAPSRQAFGHFTDPVVVYDVLDDLAIYDDAHLPTAERVATHHPALMREADLVVASSPALVERHRGERPDLLLVPNGADQRRFATPAARPADLPPPDPERPIVGYHGAVGEWLDYALLTAVAKQRPDWRFVLVGPIRPAAQRAAAALAQLTNVTVLGERPSDAMPGYVQAFDVGAIWFAVDRLTEAVSPLKLYECLAAATPCVSTPLPVAQDEPAVRVAADACGFVAELEAARADAADQAWRARAAATAAAASWERRIEPLLERLEGIGRRRAPAA